MISSLKTFPFFYYLLTKKKYLTNWLLTFITIVIFSKDAHFVIIWFCDSYVHTHVNSENYGKKSRCGLFDENIWIFIRFYFAFVGIIGLQLYIRARGYVSIKVLHFYFFSHNIRIERKNFQIFFEPCPKKFA